MGEVGARSVDLRVDTIHPGDPTKEENHARCSTSTSNIHQFRLPCATGAFTTASFVLAAVFVLFILVAL